MTVREFIEALKEMPEEADVLEFDDVIENYMLVEPCLVHYDGLVFHVSIQKTKLAPQLIIKEGGGGIK